MPINNPGSPAILADFREKPSGIPRLLSGEGINVCLTTLKTGDYLINNKLLIERKSAEDFIQSLVSGRLFNQCARLAKAVHPSFLLLEGDPYQTAHQIADQAIKGALLSVMASWRIPVVYTKDAGDSAYQMIMLGYQAMQRDEFVRSYGYKPKRIKAHRLRFLQGLPQTGPVRAKRLYDHFGSIEAIVRASENELQQVEGIGAKAAKSIREFVLETSSVEHPVKIISVRGQKKRPDKI